MSDNPSYRRDDVREIAGCLMKVIIVVGMKPGVVVVKDAFPAVGVIVCFPHVLSPLGMRGLVCGPTLVRPSLRILRCIHLS
jgi:hypothetical protein